MADIGDLMRFLSGQDDQSSFDQYLSVNPFVATDPSVLAPPPPEVNTGPISSPAPVSSASTVAPVVPSNGVDTRSILGQQLSPAIQEAIAGQLLGMAGEKVQLEKEQGDAMKRVAEAGVIAPSLETSIARALAAGLGTGVGALIGGWQGAGGAAKTGLESYKEWGKQDAILAKSKQAAEMAEVKRIGEELKQNQKQKTEIRKMMLEGIVDPSKIQFLRQTGMSEDEIVAAVLKPSVEVNLGEGKALPRPFIEAAMEAAPARIKDVISSVEQQGGVWDEKSWGAMTKFMKETDQASTEKEKIATASLAPGLLLNLRRLAEESNLKTSSKAIALLQAGGGFVPNSDPAKFNVASEQAALAYAFAMSGKQMGEKEQALWRKFFIRAGDTTDMKFAKMIGQAQTSQGMLEANMKAWGASPEAIEKATKQVRKFVIETTIMKHLAKIFKENDVIRHPQTGDFLIVNKRSELGFPMAKTPVTEGMIKRKASRVDYDEVMRLHQELDDLGE